MITALVLTVAVSVPACEPASDLYVPEPQEVVNCLEGWGCCRVTSLGLTCFVCSQEPVCKGCLFCPDPDDLPPQP